MNAIYDYLITKANIREKMQQQGKVSIEEVNGNRMSLTTVYDVTRDFPMFPGSI